MKTHSDLQIHRKIFHIATALFYAGLYLFFFEKNQIGNIALLSIGIVMFFEIMKFRFSQTDNKHMTGFIEMIYREKEIQGLTSLFFAAFAFAIITFLATKESVIYALLILGLCDPVANCFGYYFGKRKIWGRKSFEGALSFFIASILVACLTAQIFMLGFLALAKLIFIGLLATITEVLSTKLDDSFTVPIVSSFWYDFLIR